MYVRRFENDENATAPAQRVHITHDIDTDLDFRSFKLGSFGFGNFTLELDFTRGVFQDYLDFIEERGFLLSVRAGLDIIKGTASWILETIDPATGLFFFLITTYAFCEISPTL